VATLLAAPALAAGQATAEGWNAVWDELARLKSLPETAPEYGALGARLARHAEGESPRAGLLAAQLAALRGGSAPRPATTGWEPTEREHWLLVEVLPKAERGTHALAALQRSAGPATPLEREALLVAWNAGVDSARAQRFDLALAIQSELHRRYRQVWSTIDLGVTLRLSGDYAGADRVFADQIELEGGAGRSTGELWNRRGINALGSGDGARGRDHLGRALAMGSDDAGVVLARLDLAAGRVASARAGFRALTLTDDPGPWALRGWGLSLLPARERPARRTADSTPETTHG
jgi:hypothetical protein